MVSSKNFATSAMTASFPALFGSMNSYTPAESMAQYFSNLSKSSSKFTIEWTEARADGSTSSVRGLGLTTPCAVLKSRGGRQWTTRYGQETVHHSSTTILKPMKVSDSIHLAWCPVCTTFKDCHVRFEGTLRRRSSSYIIFTKPGPNRKLLYRSSGCPHKASSTCEPT